jgi:hypothetical protein
MDIARTPTLATTSPATLPSITIPAPAENEANTASETPRIRRHLADRTRTPDIAKDSDDKGIELSDVIDILNPLQHIPFVSSLYRELTGDTISPSCKIAGGALLGGPLGLISSVCDVVVTEENGKSVGDSVVAMILPPQNSATPTAIARNKPITDITVASTTPTALPAEPLRVASTTIPNDANQAVLDLYGASAQPLAATSRTSQAARAYHNADMLSYLKHTSLNAVM